MVVVSLDVPIRFVVAAAALSAECFDCASIPADWSIQEYKKTYYYSVGDAGVDSIAVADNDSIPAAEKGESPDKHHLNRNFEQG